jgi:hypothetical protein
LHEGFGSLEIDWFFKPIWKIGPQQRATSCSFVQKRRTNCKCLLVEVGFAVLPTCCVATDVFVWDPAKPRRRDSLDISSVERDLFLADIHRVQCSLQCSFLPDGSCSFQLPCIEPRVLLTWVSLHNSSDLAMETTKTTNRAVVQCLCSPASTQKPSSNLGLQIVPRLQVPSRSHMALLAR